MSARRNAGRSADYEGVTHPEVRPDPALGLLELYDDALPHVYGYLLARCGDTGLAEDLTAESFLAAVHAVRKPGAPDPSIPWLIGVARHKLADHWRRVEREQRGLRLISRVATDTPTIGMAVEVAFEARGEAFIPVFVPAP